MGLLDDAIRDHLELKRRRGADPGEVAREQREALQPGFDEEAALDEPGERAYEGPDPETGGAATPAGARAASSPTVEAGSVAGDGAVGAQETAELDMQTVLESTNDGHPPVAAGDSRADPGGAEGGAGADEAEVSARWEVPGDTQG